MAIDPKLPIPVYFQLKTLLLEEILEGRYGLDGRLPTEHELCARHGISRTPVTRALLEELDEHWVAGEYEHDFLAPLLLAGRALGRTFAVHAEADVAGLWYRRAGLEAVGLGPPATWAELRAGGRALAGAGR